MYIVQSVQEMDQGYLYIVQSVQEMDQGYLNVVQSVRTGDGSGIFVYCTGCTGDCPGRRLLDHYVENIKVCTLNVPRKHRTCGMITCQISII